MATSAAKNKKRPYQEDPASRYNANLYAIGRAKEGVRGSSLGPLLSLVRVETCYNLPGDPKAGDVDPEQGIVRLNPYFAVSGRSLGDDRWEAILAHLLLHLGLNHAARRDGRDPLVWSVACDIAADRLLPLFGVYSPFVLPDSPPVPPIPDRDRLSEEALYEELIGERNLLAGKWRMVSLAGPNRSDIAGLERPHHAWRRDYEGKLAQGISRAAQRAIEEAAETLNEASEAAGDLWPPLQRARRWVLNELPLLGALAEEIRVIADDRVCDGMGISVAAVNGFLGEMYFRRDCGLSDPEVLFVYAHELLHVALMHHLRDEGRDPYIYNLAADFVINGWLVEMGVGQMPAIGALYDPRLKGMSAEEVYDLIAPDKRACRKMRGFRGQLGDVLLDGPRRIYRGDVSTLDDVIRRCLRVGVECHHARGRGLVPAGLLEEIRSLFTPPVPWDVELARWMDRHVPRPEDFRRSYARASRRQASTPDIPRAARYIPQEVLDACTFGVVLDTSGSMDRQLLGRALGAIASYAEAREVPSVRLVLCDAAPYDRGYVAPADLRGVFPIQGRGGTILQPAVSHLLRQSDFPPGAPVMILTDGWCEEEIVCPREHCFVLPRKGWKEGGVPLRTSAPVFRVLKEAHEPDSA